MSSTYSYPSPAKIPTSCLNPAPSASLEGFGDSALLFGLYTFVPIPVSPAMSAIDSAPKCNAVSSPKVS